MTDLVLRKIRWDFDDTVPFLWQPANPNFGIFCNVFTFIAVPFERYIIKALRQAQDRFDESPAVAAEADAFLRQEGQHAAAHRKHMTALIAQYPGLERAYDDATRAFDRLLAEHPVEFHAAYIANLEATFTPLFKVVLDNRDSLFAGSDQRVASLMTWHFVEEIEHRSSGLILYRHLSPDPWYRVRRIRDTFRHIGDVAADIAKTIDDVVPLAERGASAQELMSISLLVDEFKYRGPGAARRRARRTGVPTQSVPTQSVPTRSVPTQSVPTMFNAVPTSDLAKMVWRLALSQAPSHDPGEQPLPAWADTWMAEYERGTDMTTFAGQPPAGRTAR